MTYNLIKNVKTHRWIIVATIFVAIVCNYLDRQLLSILKPEILAHYDITNLEYAWIVNIFLICYAVMYPMAGMLVDRFGPKRVMFCGIAIWSLACVGGGLAPNAVVFALCRGILGLAEPTIFAGQLVAVTLWFEKRQRATANSLCTIGGSLGAVIAPVAIAWLMRLLSYWQYVFILSGVIGLVVALLWQFIYKTPSDEVMRDTLSDDLPAEGAQAFSFRTLFKTKTLWGGLLIRLISDPVWYFCCFWLPGFLRSMGAKENLTTQQTLDLIQWIGGIPFLIGAIGGVLTSMWSDHMVRSGRLTPLSARKVTLISTVMIAPLCIFVPFIAAADTLAFGTKIGLVIAIFSLIAVMCLSWLYTFPVILAETFPIKNVATVMGICCGAGALGSTIFNQFVGVIPEQGWTVLFIVMGTLHLLAAVILSKMVRKEQY